MSSKGFYCRHKSFFFCECAAQEGYHAPMYMLYEKSPKFRFFLFSQRFCEAENNNSKSQIWDVNSFATWFLVDLFCFFSAVFVLSPEVAHFGGGECWRMVNPVECPGLGLKC